MYDMVVQSTGIPPSVVIRLKHIIQYHAAYQFGDRIVPLSDNALMEFIDLTQSNLTIVESSVVKAPFQGGNFNRLLALGLVALDFFVTPMDHTNVSLITAPNDQTSLFCSIEGDRLGSPKVASDGPVWICVSAAKPKLKQATRSNHPLYMPFPP